jgi:hypothetical protein
LVNVAHFGFGPLHSSNFALFGLDPVATVQLCSYTFALILPTHRYTLEHTGPEHQRVFSIPIATVKSRFGQGNVLINQRVATPNGMSNMPTLQMAAHEGVGRGRPLRSATPTGPHLVAGGPSADLFVGDAMPPQKYDDYSGEFLIVASKAAGGAGREHATAVSNTVVHPSQPAGYGGAQVYEEMDDPNGYTALGVGSTVYATVSESLSEFETHT